MRIRLDQYLNVCCVEPSAVLIRCTANTIYLQRHGTKHQRVRTAWCRNSFWQSPIKKRVESRKRDASGNYVDANPNVRTHAPKYTLEQWHTISHDVELEMHPETLLLKEGVELSEDEINELRRQRRMERQPELSAELDQIVIWLHDILKKKGRKTIQLTVRAIENRRIAKSFDVLPNVAAVCQSQQCC